MTMRSSNQLPPNTFNLGDAKNRLTKKRKHTNYVHTHTHTSVIISKKHLRYIHMTY